MESDKTVSAISHGFGGESVSRARSNNGRTSGPTRRSTKGQWTPEEDEILCKAVQKYKGKNWKKIAECFKDRTDVQCLHRWQKVLNPDLIKGPWSKEEDEIIIQLVNKYGPKKWSLIAQHLPGRIGKQCRERWHNHLNPAINKEAWTQEEELVLIRAHQTFGNRWAELTKFLPGRSDNAIKNHWNSSVKKKLDSYMASGLLSQLPPLPMPQNQPMPTSSSRKLNNGYGSVPIGAEAEEMSECSQESEIVACSQSRSEMTNLVLEAKEEMQWTEDNGLGKEHSLSFLPHIMRYYPLDDINISIPERSSEVGCSSKHLEQNFPNNIESFAGRICQFDMHQLPDISSLQLGLESSGFPMQCTDMNRNQESTNILFQNSAGMFSKSMEAIAMGSDKLEHMIMSDDEFCRVLFSDERNDGGSSYSNVPKDTNMAELGGCSDSSLSQSATIQNLELYGHTESEAVGTCHQSCQPAPSLLSNDDNALIANRVSEDLHKIYEEEITTMPHDVISNINDCSYSSHDGGAESTSMQEQLDVINDPPKLVPVNSFSPQLDNVQICPSPDKKPDSTTGQQEGGFLCYEPPRFPSLDIPVFSCDLIQSGGEMQQDYSPLGIRKLMSSMDCMSPFKLWDSPSRDDNPIAVLKSAAKTFKGTPSILKKRSRDLLSPLSDRRLDKKLGTDWTKNFSHLDVIYDENGFYRTSRLPLASPLRMISETLTEGKKKLGHPDDIGKDKGRDNFALLSGRLLEKDFENCAGKQGTTEDCENGKLDADTAVHAVQKPSEVLIEHDVNDIQLHSPNKVCCGTIGSLIHGTPKSPLCQNSLVSSKRSINVQKFSSGKSHLLPGSSSRLCRKSAAVTSSHTISTSTPLEIRVDNSRKETCSEAFSIFGDTPFKRSIESPSAWKSPWFFNSLFSFPGIEDMDCYISPGNRSYDALGLMKQISEHTAASYAEAQELLGNETPEKLSDDRCFLNQSVSLQNEQSPRNCSSLNPKFQTECRTLDFSGCETPGKGAEHEISSSSLAYSSPSSYLLKACR